MPGCLPWKLLQDILAQLRGTLRGLRRGAGRGGLYHSKAQGSCGNGREAKHVPPASRAVDEEVAPKVAQQDAHHNEALLQAAHAQLRSP